MSWSNMFNQPCIMLTFEVYKYQELTWSIRLVTSAAWCCMHVKIYGVLHFLLKCSALVFNRLTHDLLVPFTQSATWPALWHSNYSSSSLDPGLQHTRINWLCIPHDLISCARCHWKPLWPRHWFGTFCISVAAFRWSGQPFELDISMFDRWITTNRIESKFWLKLPYRVDQKLGSTKTGISHFLITGDYGMFMGKYGMFMGCLRVVGNLVMMHYGIFTEKRIWDFPRRIRGFTGRIRDSGSFPSFYFKKIGSESSESMNVS
jgi:hypothetical protein